MFCEKCGSQLPDNAAFCTNCGASINGVVNSTEKILDNEVQLNVKPTFSLGYMTIPTIIIYWSIAIILAIILGILESRIATATIVVAIFGFIIYGLFGGIGLLFKKKQYDNYSYDFYKTKVVFQESFLNKSEKEVKYKYIREVAMRQTLFQRFFNLGNIVLYTNAETGYGNGIFIVNITDVQETYKKIKTIIDV